MKLIKLLPAALATLLLSGCFSHQPTLETALIEPKQVTAAISLENQLNARKDVAIPANENWFKVIPGNQPVIITAPHSTRPFREGKKRFSDGGGTAALAVAIGEMTGASVIYTTYEGPSDPNYYDNNAFKRTLDQLIEQKKPKLLLDLHGSHPFRSYDIDLGTMYDRSLLGQTHLIKDLINQLDKEGIKSISNNRFPAAKHQTIAKFASARGIPSMQLEVNATYISPAAGNIEAQRFSKLLQALVRFIDHQGLSQ